MNKAYIKAIAHYLPETVLDNGHLNEMFPEWSVEKISSKTGIYQRHISGEGEYSSDLAVKAAEKLFADGGIDRNTIDFILMCTQSPDYFLPTTACLLQERLHLPIKAGALDFNLGCSGYIYGLGLAKGLITAGIAKNILLITAETYSKFIHPKDKSNRTIFGDAAAATLVSTTGVAEILDFELGTDGRGAENLIVKQGGVRYPVTETGDEEVADEFGNVNSDKYLYMNGSEIFNFTSEMVPALVNDTLAKHQLTVDDIALYVFHQANRFMLNHLRKKLKIPEEKFYLYLENCGNTVSSTIPIAL
ncbi:MAG: ketoacyl-ACP synthase III, partial [Chitinophagia bacterium]|nr:ketoacyl-ACP synthase III [Chitinophagia bacterium]